MPPGDIATVANPSVLAVGAAIVARITGGVDVAGRGQAIAAIAAMPASATAGHHHERGCVEAADA